MLLLTEFQVTDHFVYYVYGGNGVKMASRKLSVQQVYNMAVIIPCYYVIVYTCTSSTLNELVFASVSSTIP